LPHEHGAYAQLAFPLLTALWLGTPSRSAWLLAAATVAAFLAHEPLLIASGARGRSKRARDGARAVRWLLALGAAAFALGAAGLSGAPRAAWAAAAVPAALSAALGLFIARGKERTTAGELLAACALVSLSLPLSTAAKVPEPTLATCAGVWIAVYGVATLAVRFVLLRAKGERAGRHAAGAVLLAAAAFGIGAATWVGGLASPAAALALVPGCLISLGLLIFPPSLRHLKRVGWALVGASAATLAALAGGLR
jgi:YwiC-like protein